MWNRLLLILIIMPYLPISILGQPIDEDNPIISWDPIPNASSYRLQIRNEDEEIILEEDLDETSFNLNLDPGKYSHRVGAYNKFKKIASYSEWFPFVIAQILAPEVTSEKKIQGSKKDLEKIILLKGKNFYKNSIVSIKNETASVKILDIKIKKGLIELTLDNKNAKAGNYDLIIENPRKKILIIKNYYILKSDSIFTATVDSSYPYWKEAARSALLPGWGQVRKKHIFSGIFLDLLLIAGAGYYKSRLDAFDSAKGNYENTVFMGILYQELKIPGGGIYGIISSESQFSKVKSAAASIAPAATLIVAVYTLNILDAFLWKSSIESSKKEVSFHFFTKIQMTPVANGNLNSNLYSNTSQVEVGLRFGF